ncbi:hypothetical protein [Symmachiella dynata]|uniref:hypothetical protein n=1 Tax=Symmachiella dynata TaxID=2527995 RepID=UPI0030EDE8FA
MTTDKSKWWQGWVIYAIVVLLVTVGSYVGGYLWLWEHEELGWFRKHTVFVSPHASLPPYIPHDHVRKFELDWLRTVFAPLGWAEANIRGEALAIEGPLGNRDVFQPDW